MILLDTNVLLDVVTDDPTWADWSIAQLEAASLGGAIWINDIVYAELSVRYDRIQDVDGFLDQAGLELAAVPREALLWQARFSHDIAKQAERGQGRSLISLSVRTQRSADIHCSHATSAVIAPISQR